MGTRLALAVATAAAMVASGHLRAAEGEFADLEVPDTIRVIVAYSAGGSTDALVRTVLPHFEQAIEELSDQSTSAVVVNLPGAGGEVGWTSLANADPDGSTIGIINLPAVPLVEAARDTGYEPWLESFVPLAVNVIDPNVVRLGSGTDYEDLQAAIDATKENPGSVTIGADGPLSDDHLAAYAIAQATGAEFAFVPYAGAAPANRAFQSGEVQIAIGNVFSYVQTEDVTKDAAVFAAEPYEMIPDVPTVESKLGIEAGELGSTRGFATPAGTPEEMTSLYRQALGRAFEEEEFKAEARKRNITLVRPRIGEEFGQLMQNQEAQVGELLDYFVQGGYIDAPSE